MGDHQTVRQTVPELTHNRFTGKAVKPLSLDTLRPQFLAFDIGIPLRVGPFKIAMRHQPRATVTRTDDVNHVQIAFLDQPLR